MTALRSMPPYQAGNRLLGYQLHILSHVTASSAPWHDCAECSSLSSEGRADFERDLHAILTRMPIAGQVRGQTPAVVRSSDPAEVAAQIAAERGSDAWSRRVTGDLTELRTQLAQLQERQHDHPAAGEALPHQNASDIRTLNERVNTLERGIERAINELRDIVRANADASDDVTRRLRRKIKRLRAKRTISLPATPAEMKALIEKNLEDFRS